MPDDVIAQVHQRQKNDPRLLFLDRNQQQYDDQVYEEGEEDSEYDPAGDESIKS